MRAEDIARYVERLRAAGQDGDDGGGSQGRRGRPKVIPGELSSVTERLPVVLLGRVDERAEGEGLTRSEWLRRALANAVGEQRSCDDATEPDVEGDDVVW